MPLTPYESVLHLFLLNLIHQGFNRTTLNRTVNGNWTTLLSDQQNDTKCQTPGCETCLENAEIFLSYLEPDTSPQLWGPMATIKKSLDIEGKTLAKSILMCELVSNSALKANRKKMDLP